MYGIIPETDITVKQLHKYQINIKAIIVGNSPADRVTIKKYKILPRRTRRKKKN